MTWKAHPGHFQGVSLPKILHVFHKMNTSLHTGFISLAGTGKKSINFILWKGNFSKKCLARRGEIPTCGSNAEARIALYL